MIEFLRRHGNLSVILSAVILALAVTLYYFYRPLPAPGLVYVPPDKKAESLLEELIGQGTFLSRFDAWMLKRQMPLPEGWVRFDRSLSRLELIRALRRYPREKTRRVVFYSGDTVDEFARSFGRQARLDPREILEWYYRFSPYAEGGILAGYYRIPYRTDARSSVGYMVRRSMGRFGELSRQAGLDFDPVRFKPYLIIASIIQKETWHPEEMARISAVIHNRLKRGMKLQLDATLNYGPYAHRRVTPERIRRDTSRFNTYRYRGLPPEPVGSATVYAIRAALHPASTRDLYFVRNIFGTHDFARTYGEHLANISRIKVQRARLERAKRALNP